MLLFATLLAMASRPKDATLRRVPGKKPTSL